MQWHTAYDPGADPGGSAGHIQLTLTSSATGSKVLDMQGSQGFALQSHQQHLVEGTGLFMALWARSRLGFRRTGGSICSLLKLAGSEPH